MTFFLFVYDFPTENSNNQSKKFRLENETENLYDEIVGIFLIAFSLSHIRPIVFSVYSDNSRNNRSILISKCM